MDFLPPDQARVVEEEMPDATVIAGGIRFKEIRSGEGKFIEVGDVVESIYTGRLLDGTVFNRKTGRWHTYTIEIGAKPRQVIQGWEMAIHLMQKGGIYEIAIPSQFAYKSKGRPGQVPPYATVIFEIEILDVR
ncbi:FKBP-type peptidyl-prolyl cis-trans isomerase [Puniceicoccaceae bacterium K14]|nr:FKBP-type peptidyl-prolyl cis-trans isomerase [Puniceicoccaceae bacterium K14]